MKLIISPKRGRSGVTYTVDFTINSITPEYPMKKVLSYISTVNAFLASYEIKVVAK